MDAQKCLGCGSRIELREEGDLATCLSCGSSYVKRKERLEEVVDHRYLECRCSDTEALAKGGGGADPELVYLPFWVFVGRFETEFTLSRYSETFFSVTRTEKKGTLDNETVISVPACRTENALGLSLPLASSTPLNRCYTLKEGETREFSSESWEVGHWFVGAKSQERALTEARRFVHSRQRLAIEDKFSELDVRFAEGEEIRKIYLVHRPFWVMRGKERTEVVDAHTGELVNFDRGEAVSHIAAFRANRAYTLGRVAVGFVGACLCLGPALLGTFFSEGLRLALLVPTSLAMLFFMRLFIFGLYSPYRLMARHPSVRKVTAFFKERSGRSGPRLLGVHSFSLLPVDRTTARALVCAALYRTSCDPTRCYRSDSVAHRGERFSVLYPSYSGGRFVSLCVEKLYPTRGSNSQQELSSNHSLARDTGSLHGCDSRLGNACDSRTDARLRSCFGCRTGFLAGYKVDPWLSTFEIC